MTFFIKCIENEDRNVYILLMFYFNNYSILMTNFDNDRNLLTEEDQAECLAYMKETILKVQHSILNLFMIKSKGEDWLIIPWSRELEPVYKVIPFEYQWVIKFWDYNHMNKNNDPILNKSIINLCEKLHYINDEGWLSVDKVIEIIEWCKIDIVNKSNNYIFNKYIENLIKRIKIYSKVGI